MAATITGHRARSRAASLSHRHANAGAAAAPGGLEAAVRQHLEVGMVQAGEGVRVRMPAAGDRCERPVDDVAQRPRTRQRGCGPAGVARGVEAEPGGGHLVERPGAVRPGREVDGGAQEILVVPVPRPLERVREVEREVPAMQLQDGDVRRRYHQARLYPGGGPRCPARYRSFPSSRVTTGSHAGGLAASAEVASPRGRVWGQPYPGVPRAPLPIPRTVP